MRIYNLMNCRGFGTEFLGGCSMGWFGLVIVFFVAALLRKWGGEEFDIPFNFLSSIGLGFLSYVLLVTLTGSTRWSLLAGIIGVLIGAYVTPIFYDEGFGGGGESYG